MKPLLDACILGLALALAPSSVSAGYPEKPVKLIVPFPPGGLLDIVARVVVPRLSEGLGQPVVVDNRAGAAGTVGMEVAARSPADGYTVAMGSTGTLASAPSFYPTLGYDPIKSFAPVSLLVDAPFLVVAHPAVPASSLRELIEVARSRPNELNFGSLGNGGPPHIAGEMFKLAADVQLVHVPYKGFPAALADLLTGRIQVMFNQAAPFQPHIIAGKLRALAVAGRERLPQLPTVPTTAEAGLAGFEVSVWFGLVVPKGTSAEIVSRLNQEVRKALAASDVRDSLLMQGFQPRASSPEQFDAFLASETAKWSRAVKLSGAKLD